VIVVERGTQVADREIQKRAVLHRKNSLFYKTDNGARTGDLYMSAIHTCDLNGVDPFDYLTQLQRHAKEVRAHPEQWLPWNYRRALKRLPDPQVASPGPPLN
jgi:transposase